MTKPVSALLIGAAVLSMTIGAAKPKPKHAGSQVLPIAIVINGTKLAVDPPPRFYKYHLLVPVRRTLVALGLDFVKEGKMITTSAAAKTISLTIGSKIAHVDEQPVELDAAPVEIDNVLYAPLRFFTEALGAQAVFDRQTNSVDIISTLVGRSGSGMVSMGGSVEVMGTVTALDVNADPPTLTLTHNATVRTLTIDPSADVVVQDVNTGTSNPGELAQVRPGDYAHVYLNRAGNVKHIVDAYGSRAGRVAAVSGGQLVLDDGHVITPSRDTVVTLNGDAISIDQIAVGDSVMVHYNIDSSEPLEISATRPSTGTPPPAARVVITSITMEPKQPLHQGDKLFVTMHGTPGGLANYDIGPYVKNLPIAEQSPGVYTGVYTIPPGVNFASAPLFGHLNVGGVDALAAESQATLSVSTEPPGITDFAPDNGAVVNNSRPSIYATFSSETVPVNSSSATLEVNGHDVTSSSQRTDRFIHYTPGIDYPAGPVHVTVRVSDQAGNVAAKSWTFFIRS